MLEVTFSTANLAVIPLAFQELPVGESFGSPVPTADLPSRVLGAFSFGANTGTITGAALVIQEGPTNTGPWTDTVFGSEVSGSGGQFGFSYAPRDQWARAKVTVTGAGGGTTLAQATLLNGPAAWLAYRACLIGLYTAIDAKGLDTTFADVTAPAGDLGRQDDGIGWPQLDQNAQNRRVAIAAPITWRPADASEGETVAGWYLVADEPGQPLLAWEDFDEPIALPDENSSVTVVMRMRTPAEANWGRAVVIGP